MAPDYVTVYQISKESTDWSFALVGFISSDSRAHASFWETPTNFQWEITVTALLPIFFLRFWRAVAVATAGMR